jgi:hypothetical protein
MIDFYGIQYGSHAIESDLDAIIFNPRRFNHSKMSDVQTSEVYAKLS